MNNNLEEQLKQKIEECRRLQQENRKLKELIKFHNIKVEDHSTIVKENSKSKQRIIIDRINIYKQLFKGRNDVYALRWESSDGRSGYSPACKNEWDATLCNK